MEKTICTLFNAYSKGLQIYQYDIKLPFEN